MCDSGSCVSTSFPPTTPREGTRYLPNHRGRRIAALKRMQHDGSTPEQIPIASPVAMDTDLLKPSRSCPLTYSRRHSAPLAIPLSHCRMTWSHIRDRTVHDTRASLYPTVQPTLVSLPPDGVIVSQVCWRLQFSPQDLFVSGREHLSTRAKIMSTISYIVYVHLTWCHVTNLRDSSGRFCAIRSLRHDQYRVQSALPVR